MSDTIKISIRKLLQVLNENKKALGVPDGYDVTQEPRIGHGGLSLEMKIKQSPPRLANNYTLAGLPEQGDPHFDNYIFTGNRRVVHIDPTSFPPLTEADHARINAQNGVPTEVLRPFVEAAEKLITSQKNKIIVSTPDHPTFREMTPEEFLKVQEQGSPFVIREYFDSTTLDQPPRYIERHFKVKNDPPDDDQPHIVEAPK